jgi:hypothetical protein
MIYNEDANDANPNLDANLADEARDQFDVPGEAIAVPLFEGELREEWRYTCTCFGPRGLTNTYRQSLSAYVTHVLEEHASHEGLDIIARVVLAQYPPLRYGATKKNASRGSSVRGTSVQGGSVHGGSVHGGSVHGGSVHGGSVRGAPVHAQAPARNMPAPGPQLTRANLNAHVRNVGSSVPVTRPLAGGPAPSANDSTMVYARILAQNQAIMAQMENLGLTGGNNA